MDLKDFNFKHWWTLLAAGGAVIAAASIVPKSTIGFLIGVSFVFFGVGEWMNRPSKPTKVTIEGLNGFRIVDNYPWRFNWLGLIFDAIGVGLFCVAVYMISAMVSQISN